MESADNSQSVQLQARPLNPRHGIHEPRAATPRRAPGAIRRTSTIDAIRPGDVLGELHQIGRARDLLTAPDGRAHVLGEATVTTHLDYADHYRLLAIASTPDRPELQRLLGTSVSTGFRAAMVGAAPDDQEAASLLHLVLDDLPGAALVSGYAVGAAGKYPERRRDRPVLQVEGLCAGFQRGGTIMLEISAGAHAPVVTGPEAPPLLTSDELAWHELRQMGAHDMRRWRRLDAVPGATADDPVHVEVYFRDSHRAPNGVETVIHEYTVQVVVDPITETIVSSSAKAHSLPWIECIEAEGSGDRLAGRPLRGLRSSVREELVGVTTCTHLNDTMRSLEDLRAILPMLRPGA